MRKKRIRAGFSDIFREELLASTEIQVRLPWGFDDLLGHSITYRIALGPHQGRKAFTLQAVPAVAGGDDSRTVAKAAGFSLHAGAASEAHEREKLERRGCPEFCVISPG